MLLYKLTLTILILAFNGAVNAASGNTMDFWPGEVISAKAGSGVSPAAAGVTDALTVLLNPERMAEVTFASNSNFFADPDSDQNGAVSDYHAHLKDSGVLGLLQFDWPLDKLTAVTSAGENQLTQAEPMPEPVPAPAVLALLAMGLLCLSIHLKRVIAGNTAQHN